MAFHDVRLDESIALNYVGGPTFNTSVVPLVSGFETRNINWAKGRGEWDLGFPMDVDQYEAILDFFYARQGRAFAFRFKDWSDYTIGDDATDVRQSIGTGDGTTTDFQIFKRYSSGGVNYDRTITKIVSGTTRVWVNSVEQVSGWSVNLLTGLITFSVAPTNTHDISVLTEYDVPVRFVNDQLKVSMPYHALASIPSIPVIEVRGE